MIHNRMNYQEITIVQNYQVSLNLYFYAQLQSLQVQPLRLTLALGLQHPLPSTSEIRHLYPHSPFSQGK